MGKLYCVCNIASKENCNNCEKYNRIKPDYTMKCPAWKKKAYKKK